MRIRVRRGARLGAAKSAPVARDGTPAVGEAGPMYVPAHFAASDAKPYLPWGDPDKVSERVLRAAAIGHAVADLIGGPGSG
jgi:hypothetical protein